MTNYSLDIQPATKWLGLLARFGYAARGCVYSLLGGLTLLAAFEAARETDTKGAIRTLLDQPFGHVLVGLLVIGLCGYVIWRVVQAIFDPDELGTGLKGVFVRGALLVSASSYATLALYAVSLLVSVMGDSGGGGSSTVVSTLNGFFSISTITLGLAIVFGGVALAHFWKAFAGTYEQYFRTDAPDMRLIRVVSITGLTARGLIFACLSWLMILRFFNLKEDDGGDEKPGLREALNYFSELPYGQWILAAMGVGLIAFALYSLAEARWRRIAVHRLT